jgi:hypothetical protein
MPARRPIRLLEFALAEAPPARRISLCSGCAHFTGRNPDGTARCSAFAVIPAAVWAGAVDHRQALEGDGGTTFSPLSDYGVAVERQFDAQPALRLAAPVEAETEVIEAPAESRPGTPMKDAEAMDDAPAEEWHAVWVREGVPTGDRRYIEQGALTWRDLPLPLMWQTETPESGGHAHSVHAGQATRVERQGDDIHAWGYVLATDDGAAFRTHLESAGRVGVSVDMDDAQVEVDWPEEDEDDEGAMLFAEPDLVRFTEARLMGATVVPHPAFSEAYVELIAPASEEDAVVAAAIPVNPPAAWFANPELPGPTPLTITDDGRVYGHLAAWGTCHTSFQGTCVTPPFEDEYGYFTTGEVRTAEGTGVPVGKITFRTGHADVRSNPTAAAAHYDHTGTGAADVAAGADQHGIWLAGALRPGLTGEQVRELRAAAVSGDWRRIGGQLRLVAALAVNVPGFPIPRTAARVASGAQQVLVASGVVTRARPAAPDLEAIAELMAERVGRDTATLTAALTARVHLTEFACGCRKAPKAGVVARAVPASRTASGQTASYTVIAPDGTRSPASTLLEAMKGAKAVRGSYRVNYR